MPLYMQVHTYMSSKNRHFFSKSSRLVQLFFLLQLVYVHILLKSFVKKIDSLCIWILYSFSVSVYYFVSISLLISSLLQNFSISGSLKGTSGTYWDLLEENPIRNLVKERSVLFFWAVMAFNTIWFVFFKD